MVTAQRPAAESITLAHILARVVLRAGKFEHITPALIKLQWLPVKQRVLYKQALITFNV